MDQEHPRPEQVVAYIPPATQDQTARWHRQLSTQAATEGWQIAYVTSDPAEARRLAETGAADRIATATREHAEQLYPIVVPLERRRRGRGAIGTLLPVGWIGEWVRGHKTTAGAVAATTAVAAAAVMLLPMVTGPREGPAQLVEPPVAEAPGTPSPTPATPSPTPGATLPPNVPASPSPTQPTGAGGAGVRVPTSAPAPELGPAPQPPSPLPPSDEGEEDDEGGEGEWEEDRDRSCRVEVDVAPADVHRCRP